MAEKLKEAPVESEVEETEVTSRQSFKWIKADSGETYLCPVDRLKDLKDATEDDLRSICVDESFNPQNE